MVIDPVNRFVADEEYCGVLYRILEDGQLIQNDRTGVGTFSLFMKTMQFDLSRNEFPLLQTKKVAWKSVISELLWFIEGSTDERRLAEIHFGKDRSELKDKRTIWTANADEQGAALGHENNDFEKELGPVYGAQWARQLDSIINDIRNTPHSRRLILNSWNINDLPQMALPPCHVMAQFYVRDDRYLDMMMYQRSADMFLGVPFNMVSYALLLMLVSIVTGYEPGKFTHLIGDAHIYLNHQDQVREQLARFERVADIRDNTTHPMLKINDRSNIHDFTMDDFELADYNPYPAIRAEMAV